jgi:hypothetical protein
MNALTFDKVVIAFPCVWYTTTSLKVIDDLKDKPEAIPISVFISSNIHSKSQERAISFGLFDKIIDCLKIMNSSIIFYFLYLSPTIVVLVSRSTD